MANNELAAGKPHLESPTMVVMPGNVTEIAYDDPRWQFVKGDPHWAPAIKNDKRFKDPRWHQAVHK